VGNHYRIWTTAGPGEGRGVGREGVVFRGRSRRASSRHQWYPADPRPVKITIVDWQGVSPVSYVHKCQLDADRGNRAVLSCCSILSRVTRQSPQLITRTD